MQLIRFMSSIEFEKLMNGDVLENTIDHYTQGRHTNSIGFCFMARNSSPYFEDDEIISDLMWFYSFMSGIVSDDYVVVFESGDTELKKGYGIYAAPGGEFFDTMRETEYSIKSYDRTTLKPLYWLCGCDDYLYEWCEDELRTKEWEKEQNKKFVEKERAFYDGYKVGEDL